MNLQELEKANNELMAESLNLRNEISEQMKLGVHDPMVNARIERIAREAARILKQIETFNKEN